MDELPTPITRSEQYLAKAAGAAPQLPLPITREERYLAKIAGEDVDIPPVPITRTEQYLAAIVESGGGVEVEALSATENKTYTAPEGKAYSPVVVNVPNSYVAGDEGKVVSSGALVAQTSDSVTENGTVDTTLISSLEVNVPQGGGEAPEKDVNFIDYDGTILYSYTAQEFAALDALPELVSHEGMAAASAWNWTLADAKTYVAISGGLIIGQEYAKTEVDINLQSPGLSVTLGLGVNGTSTIDWGDGNTEDVTGSNATSQKLITHAYSVRGKYTIGITIKSGSANFYNSSTRPLVSDTSMSAENMQRASQIIGIRLKGDVMPSTYAFCNLRSVKSITLPHTVTTSGGYMFNACYSLKQVSLPKELTTIGTYDFAYCNALEKIYMAGVTTLNSSAFQDCPMLDNVIIPAVSSLPSSLFLRDNNIKVIISLATNPPTIGTNGLNIGGTDNTVRIYVPYSADHSVLAAYKAASGWSSRANQIVELPE